MFAQTARRLARPISRRAASSAPARDGVFKGTDQKKIWLGDAGAYPVMVGIGWCIFFCAAFGTWYMGSSPDVRLWGSSRDRQFRGEIAAEYTKK